MRVDPVTLRLFNAVMELGTVAAAAQREHITASAVSKRLSDLEELLQTPLLVRSNKGVEATPAGVALQNLSRGIINDLDNVVAQMRAYASGTRGLVRIFANVSCIAQFLPADLGAFSQKYPHVELRLEERISTEILRGVAENAADLGFFADLGLPMEGLVALPYREDLLVVVVPAGDALARRGSIIASELLKHPLIGLQTGSFINLQLMKAAAEQGQSVRFRTQVNSYDAVGLMVEARLGLGIMPQSLARRYSKALAIRCIALEAPWAARRLQVCFRSYESLSVAARLLVDQLRGSES